MNRSILPILLCALTTSLTSLAQSAWLPAPRQFVATPGFTYSTFDEFWAGRELVGPLKANDESLDQYTGFVSFEYGLFERFAADLTLGYTETSSTTTFGNDSDNGLADTSIGLRYQCLAETPVLPTVSIRLGGVIAGTYDENTPFSAGDGANAFEAALLFGKRFGESGFGAYGDVGYRVRENPVPDDVFGSVGLFKQFERVFAEFDAITLSFGYRHVQGLSGIDIPDIDPSHGFPALREINQLIEGSLGYTDNGGRYYQFTVAKSVEGRNTGDKLLFLFTISLPFGGR